MGLKALHRIIRWIRSRASDSGAYVVFNNPGGVDHKLVEAPVKEPATYPRWDVK